jgi:hypothetical protein
MTLLASGKLGIGTTNPANYRLVIAGTAAGSGFSAGLSLNGGQSGGDYDGIGYNFRNTATTGVYNYNVADTSSRLAFTAGGFSFKTAPSGTIGSAITYTDAMTIQQTGNVGIAKTAPGAALDVVGGINSTGTINGTGLCIGGDCKVSWAAVGAASSGWSQNGNEVYKTNTAGNVGIGTTAPNGKLDVTNATGNTYGDLFVRVDNSGSTGGKLSINNWASSATGNAAVLAFGLDPSTNFESNGNMANNAEIRAININGTNAASDLRISTWSGSVSNMVMALTSTGNVGIGMTNPSDLLNVDITKGDRDIFFQNGSSNYEEIFYGTAKTNANTAVLRWQAAGLSIHSYGQSYGDQLFIDADSANVGIGTTTPSTKLEVNGDVTAAAYYYSSDRNLKTNIKTLNSALEKVTKLRGVSFDWKNSGEPSLGLIAQEVQQVYPELVGGTPGNLTIQYGNLVAPLIEAVKEQQKQIDNQEKEINRLEVKVKVLESKKK